MANATPYTDAPTRASSNAVPFRLIDDTIELAVDASHIRVLTGCVRSQLAEVERWAKGQSAFSDFAEWKSINHLLDMIDLKADRVEDVATAVDDSTLTKMKECAEREKMAEIST